MGPGLRHLDTGAATGLVRAARIADRLPLLGEVLAQGKIGVGHLQAVAAGAGRVPIEVLAASQTTLRDLAPHARPGELRRVAERVQACYDQDAVAADAAHVHESRHLTLSRTFGDAYHVEGLLEPEAGAGLQAALDSLMTRRGAEDTRSAGQRRADALVELTQIGLRSGQLPDGGGDRPRVTFVVTTSNRTGAAATGPGPLDDLLSRVLADMAGALTGVGEGSLLSRSQLPGVPTTAFGTGDHHLLGTDALLPVQTIERICCDADINLTLVDAWGQPLNHGRSRRDPTPAQRRALLLRDGGCVFPGCAAPPAHCQAHHLVYWSHEGRTDLDNLALVCWFHHHLIHEGGWRLERVPARPGEPHRDTDPNRTGRPPGWLATSPDGRQLARFRQQVA